jgi:flagellin
MADTVTLSSSIRSNLLTLQKTGELVNRTNNRLSTNLRVASAIDDAVNYFQGKALNDRAADLTSRKEGVDQGISSLKSALGGLESIEKLMVQMKGVLLSAKSATSTERSDLNSQFNTLATQLTALTNDVSFQGLNLINSTAANLKVQFSEKTSAILDVTGTDNRFSATAGFTATSTSEIASSLTNLTGGWTSISAEVSRFDTIIEKMDSAIITVRSNAKTLGTNVAMLQTRKDFTSQYVNTLKEGADKLTLADLNEEGANLVSLQTRQQLGIQALSFAGQQEQGILAMFR